MIFALGICFFNGENIIIYDWELAAYGNPEHDLIEYLSFVLHEFSDSEVYDIMWTLNEIKP